MPDVKHFDPEHVLDQVVELFWRRGSASTGVGDVVAATGLSRSSLYATFGGKQELYLAALRRYVERRSRPVLEALAADGRGLPAIAAFFDQLIRARCEGPHARWGCMVSNAHAGAGGPDEPDGQDAQVRKLLDEHHARLRAAMAAALGTARSRSQLRRGVEVEATADALALLAYGVNLRSRAGAPAADLKATVTAALQSLSLPEPSEGE
ncbi:TetR/AcrR family transcriptional regulator [Actinomadura madurae]|uniref:TetR/AcrR family transcriptional regulator n=1 Tax=Actinomadura madurae TaxID=1993 RepID=UPI0020275DCE|nr:TetR/AcrR family transcriptional regulator [Actinomadura madurae]MCP9976899.1 TetR/AcrR family transcriptional regulator [Actinomadura madurae]MCQ0013083.1 TetR/AcrR family transcriptional regulator [Actinomadura madurae]URM93313.1 TetR/AcrR family transcriptional regulator [Actinomadura madurae]